MSSSKQLCYKLLRNRSKTLTAHRNKAYSEYENITKFCKFEDKVVY